MISRMFKCLSANLLVGGVQRSWGVLKSVAVVVEKDFMGVRKFSILHLVAYGICVSVIYIKFCRSNFVILTVHT